MFGSCSEPIKANKIISYATRDSQHPISAADMFCRRVDRDIVASGIVYCVTSVHLVIGLWISQTPTSVCSLK